MIFSILQSGDLVGSILSLLISLPILLLALSLHETAHGYVARKCGDNTAYNLGRLTLNPFRHLDPTGFICLLIFGFGWAKPVPVNSRNFRNPKRGMALTALAGPMANLLLGIVSTLLFGLTYGIFAYGIQFNAIKSEWVLNMLSVVMTAFQFGAMVNFVLMLFNLIPVPPFDGSRIALLFLPEKAYFGIMRYERQIMFGIMLALLLLSFFNVSPFGWLASKLTSWIGTPVANGVFRLLVKMS